MSGGEFAAIEARAEHSARTEWGLEELADDTFIYGKVGYYGFIAATCDNPYEADMFVQALADRESLLAAVRERDNTIARVREVLEDYDGLDAEPIPKLSTHTWMHEVRAALDPQETE